MLKELVQELSQILTVVENLTNENEELKVKQSTLNSQLLETNESYICSIDSISSKADTSPSKSSFSPSISARL